MRRLAPDLAHALAAEYVLGTLRGAARRRFEAIASRDEAVRQAVRRWEASLLPLVDRLAPVEPPPRVWQGIERRIGNAPAAPAEPAGWFSSLAFWRGFGLVSGGLAAVLLAIFLARAPSPAGDQPVMMAVLTAKDEPRLVVAMHGADELRINVVRPWRSAEGKSLELWVVPAQGAPRSLGLVPNAAGEVRMRMPARDPRMLAANAFALSMEPPGGSPTKQPTGPVLCSGPVVAMKRA